MSTTYTTVHAVSVSHRIIKQKLGAGDDSKRLSGLTVGKFWPSHVTYIINKVRTYDASTGTHISPTAIVGMQRCATAA